MHDAAGMRGGESGSQVARDRPGFVNRERAFRDPFLQCRPVNVRHGDVRTAALLPRLVERAHVRVVERGGRLRFAQEPRAGHRVRRERRREELERHEPLQPDILGLIDHAHAAAAEQAHDPIPAGEQPRLIERRRFGL